MSEKAEGALIVANGKVIPEWIDINGHMNVAYYVLAFDHGVDSLWSRAGITDEYINNRMLSTFAVESHITYQAELKLDDPFTVTTRILALDDKRLHQFQWLHHAEKGFLAATAEWLNLHVNMRTRRVCPFPDDILAGFLQIANEQHASPLPTEMGSKMRVPVPRYSVPGY